MEVKITKVTDIELARAACEFTINGQITSRISMNALCRMEHSPLRAMMYKVEMYEIKSFVSTHFVRHKIGVEHFVMTNRVDRGSSVKADRNSPVDHMMILNAEALINLAKKRLCYQASPETRDVMAAIKKELNKIEPTLAEYLVPNCIYRGGMCPERPCGFGKMLVKQYASYFDKFTNLKE